MERSEHTEAVDAAETKTQFDGTFEYTNSDTLHNIALALGKVTGALRPDGETSGFRFNVREAQLEYRAAFTGGWHPASPAWLARLLEEAERVYWLQRHGWKARRPLRFQQQELDRACLVLTDKYPCDPFKDWLLHDLPAWDGIARIDGLLTATFGATDTALTRWASRYLLLAPVQRAMKPGCLLRELPVLIGPQGVGKSALLRELFPKDQQARWFSDSYSLHEQDPGRQIEATAGAALVEIPELAGLRKAEIERVKADISRREDRWRLAYRRDAETHLRRFAFVGTSNDPTVLPDDPSGNTRFVPVECPYPYHVEKGLPDGREQLWAEAVARYRSDEKTRANLPYELRAEQAAVAEQHRDRDDHLEAALPAALDHLGQVGTPLTHTAIVTECGLDPKSRGDNRRVRSALTRIGYCQRWDRIDGRRLRLWEPAPEAT